MGRRTKAFGRGRGWGSGSAAGAARRRPACASQVISSFEDGGLLGKRLARVEFSGPEWGLPAFPLSLLVRPPPFWVRWRGHLRLPALPRFLLFAAQLPKTDVEGRGWGVKAS